MDNNTSKKFHTYDSDILEICEEYPAIKLENVEYAIKVFYPVANIELTLQEKTFEDFDPVQKYVLKLIKLSYNDPEIIAKLLGLNAIYVTQIIKLLHGYGLIDENCVITDTGLESVECGKKVLLHNTRQLFQLDTINSNLITVDSQIQDTNAKEKEFLSQKVIILDYPEAIDEDLIKQSLMSDNFRRIMSKRNDILNANVVNVKDIECNDVLYVTSYFIKLRQYNDGIIFSKRDNTLNDNHKKYRWLPFYVTDIGISNMLSLENIALIAPDKRLMISERVRLFVDHSFDKKFENVISKRAQDVLSLYRLKNDGVRVSGDKIEITNEDAIRSFDNQTIKFLYNLGKYGVYFVFSEEFYAKHISIKITDPTLKAACKKLCDIVDRQDADSVFRKLKIAITKIQTYAKKNNCSFIQAVKEI